MRFNTLYIAGVLLINPATAVCECPVVKIANYRNDKACAVSYTFDDGLAEHYTLAAPELEKRGFRGTFFLNGAKINTDGNNPADTTRLTWQQVKEMSERGHEMSNHGWAHKNFARFPLDVLKDDILKNDSAIYACTGIRPRTFAYPNNNRSEPGHSFVQQNRVGTRVKQRSVGSKRTLDDLNNWLDTLIAHKEWGVGMTHGLTYGYDAFVNPQRLWEHWDYVKQHQDSVWVGTFAEIAAYVAERNNVKLTVKQSGKNIYIVPRTGLDSDLFNEPLTMVVYLDTATDVTAIQNGKNLEVIRRNNRYIFPFSPHDGIIRLTYK